MPNYKTHEEHGKMIFPMMDKRIFIPKKDFGIDCYGFDTLLASDFNLFELQHEKHTGIYFKTLLKYIKENKLYTNSEIMAFLYGQLDHFALDVTTHPLIYSLTENIPKKHIFDAHALVEHEIDNYIKQKYNLKDEEYYVWKINSPKLRELINNVYKAVYKKSNVATKYDLGLSLLNVYDKALRKNSLKLTPFVCTLVNTGNVAYNDDSKKNKLLLNLKHKVWKHPETGEEFNKSFDDLWNESFNLSLETIDSVNKYLYDGKELNAKLINDNISLNTGLPCEKGQTNTYAKQYSLGKQKKNR